MNLEDEDFQQHDGEDEEKEKPEGYSTVRGYAWYAYPCAEGIRNVLFARMSPTRAKTAA